MVYNTARIGCLFMSYDYQKFDRSAEIEIWADYTLRYKSGFWQNLAMPLPETRIQKMPLTNSTFRWLLIWPISMHGLIATGF
jgi:hypothetical protein